MKSVTKFSYYRLKSEGSFDDGEGKEDLRTFTRQRSFSRLRKFTVRKRLKLRIPSLRRLFRRRARFLSRVRVSLAKAMKRLKNGQAYINDLVGGNFLVMQANPTPFKCGNNRSSMRHGLPGLPPRYPVGRIA